MKKTTITETYNDNGKLIKKETVIEEYEEKNYPTLPTTIPTPYILPTTIPTPYILPTIDTKPMCNENNDFTKGLKDFYRKWGDIPKDV